jgi:hypothetical protein
MVPLTGLAGIWGPFSSDLDLALFGESSCCSDNARESLTGRFRFERAPIKLELPLAPEKYSERESNRFLCTVRTP